MLSDIDGVKFLNWYANNDTKRLLKSVTKKNNNNKIQKFHKIQIKTDS